MTRRSKLLIAAVIVLVLAGVGVFLATREGSSPEATVDSFISAYTAEKFGTACGLLDEQAADLVVVVGGTMSPNGGEDCENDLAVVANQLKIGKAEVRDVDVSPGGELASVDTSQGEWSLEELDGGWEITAVGPIVEFGERLLD